MSLRPSSRPPESARRAGALVRIVGPGLIVPPGCACCGEPASGSDAVRSPGGTELFVGYCADCLRHLGAERTKRLAGVVSSAVLGATLALSLPLASQPLAAGLVAGLTLLGSVIPLVVVALWPRVPGRGHTATGVAARFVREGVLVAANDRWAFDLARENATTREHAPFREHRLSLVMLPAVVLSPVLALVVLYLVSPIVRVVNLTGETLTLEVDGRRVASVEATSLESPTAGVELRVASGRRELVARGVRGNVLERASVVVRAARPHLFAPASEGSCFWLETRGYGRGDPGVTQREPLAGPPHFWSLPPALAGFFSPAPDAALSDARLTGGVVTVVRQGPCDAES